ncbi:MAG: hypothetical protein N4A35_10965 [Flavobacteriales bacterium]|jgi:hypothetical protein|nr:hypothetical protein [Flavobacteriales bacterium]
MKNILFIILSLMVLKGSAQENLFKSIENMGLNTIYKVYGIYKSGDGYELEARSFKLQFSIINNKFDKPAGLNAKMVDQEKTYITYNNENDLLDHYSNPSYIRTNRGFNETYLVVDSVIYCLWSMKEDASSFELKSIYLPVFKKEKSNKKLSLKEKMAAAKNAVKDASGEMKYLGQLKKKDHEKVIKDYIAAMQKIQPAYTAQEQKEIAEIKADIARGNAAIKAKNDAYWASEEGQAMRKRMNEDNNQSNAVGKCIIVNDLDQSKQSKNNDVRLAFSGSSVAAKSLLKGHQIEVDCDDVKVYVGVEAGTERKRYLFSTNGACGKTIYLSKYW